MKNTRIGKLVVAALFVPLIAGAFVALAPQSTKSNAEQQTASGMTAWQTWRFEGPAPWPGKPVA